MSVLCPICRIEMSLRGTDSDEEVVCGKCGRTGLAADQCLFEGAAPDLEAKRFVTCNHGHTVGWKQGRQLLTL